jgi:hypothetical protein
VISLASLCLASSKAKIEDDEFVIVDEENDASFSVVPAENRISRPENSLRTFAQLMFTYLLRQIEQSQQKTFDQNQVEEKPQRQESQTPSFRCVIS